MKLGLLDETLSKPVVSSPLFIVWSRCKFEMIWYCPGCWTLWVLKFETLLLNIFPPRKFGMIWLYDSLSLICLEYFSCERKWGLLVKNLYQSLLILQNSALLLLKLTPLIWCLSAHVLVATVLVLKFKSLSIWKYDKTESIHHGNQWAIYYRKRSTIYCCSILKSLTLSQAFSLLLQEESKRVFSKLANTPFTNSMAMNVKHNNLTKFKNSNSTVTVHGKPKTEIQLINPVITVTMLVI